MSHVDEGLLHAYLDGAFAPGDARGDEIGAHIASCADCRVRLEDARALKDRAREVLRPAAPADVRVPPFAALRARKHGAPHPGASARTAATEAAGARRLARSPVRLAWAASMVLAVGAGWMANELVRRDVGESAAMQDAVTPVATRDAATSAARAVTEDAPRRGSDTRATAQAGAGSAAPGVDPRPSPPPLAEGAGVGAAQDTARRPDRDAEPGGAAPGRDALGKGSGQAGERAARDTPPPTVAGAREGVNLRNDVQLDALVSDTNDTLRADTANPMYRRMRQAARGAIDQFASVPAVPRAGAAGPEITRTAYQPGDVIALDTMPAALADGRAFAGHVALLNDYTAAAGGGLWSSATIELATAALGQEPVGIEGWPPATIETAVVNGRLLVQLHYALEGGASLELIQRPDAATGSRAEATALRGRAAVLPPAGVPFKDLGESSPAFQGESLVAVSRPGLVLLLKGSLPQRTLHAIAARIE